MQENEKQGRTEERAADIKESERSGRTEERESVYAYMARNAAGSAEKLVYLNRRYSAAEVLAEIARLAGFLYAGGVRQGDCVGIALPNFPAGIFAFYAANRLGAAANLMHPKIASAQMERQLIATRSKVLFLYDGVYKQHAAMLERLGIPVILCSAADDAAGVMRALLGLVRVRAPKTVAYATIPAGLPFTPGVCPQDVCAYIHSGGTGGEPKTVALSNANLNALCDTLVTSVWQRTPDETILMMLPLFHGFGLGVPMHTFLSFGRTVLIPAFDARGVVRLLRRERVTFLAGIPAMYRKLLQQKGFDRVPMAGWRYLFCGGDALGEELRAAFNSTLAAHGCKAELLQGYGLTEATTVVTVCRPGRVKPNSVGEPLGNVQIVILDEGGEALPAGEQGEIVVSAPMLMVGYLNDPDATARTLFWREGKLWCHTGDVGYLDEDGQLFFLERSKRSLKISGVNVFPAEIERVAKELPGVRDCCAARKYTPEGKPYVELWVVADKGVRAEDIRAGIAGQLHAYSVPRSIRFTPEIKRTPIAKADFAYYEQLKD